MALRCSRASQRLGRDTFTTGQVAALFGVAPRTVANWEGRGDLPCFRPFPGQHNKHRRFLREDVLSFARRSGCWHAVRALEMGENLLCVGLAAVEVDDLKAHLPGWEVASTISAVEASWKLCEWKAGVALVHHSIRRCDCFRLADVVRQSRSHGGVSLVGVTGPDETDPHGWLDAGYDATLTRFDPTGVAAIVLSVWRGAADALTAGSVEWKFNGNRKRGQEGAAC